MCRRRSVNVPIGCMCFSVPALRDPPNRSGDVGEGVDVHVHRTYVVRMSPELKNVRFEVRLTEPEAEALKLMAEINRLMPADVLRQAIRAEALQLAEHLETQAAELRERYARAKVSRGGTGEPATVMIDRATRLRKLLG